MSQLVTVTKHFWPLSSRFLAITFRDIALYVVNIHRIARTITYRKWPFSHFSHSDVQKVKVQERYRTFNCSFLSTWTFIIIQNRTKRFELCFRKVHFFLNTWMAKCWIIRRKNEYSKRFTFCISEWPKQLSLK